MVYDLSGFRNIEDFSFGGWKEWRQNIRYRSNKRAYRENLAERWYDIVDPSDPNVKPGDFRDIQQARDDYLAWARWWLGPWTAEENGGEGVAISHEELTNEGDYGYLMGIRWYDTGGPYRYQTYRFAASTPERIGFLQESYLRQITRTQAEEDNLAATFATQWAQFQANKIANGVDQAYGDFELVGFIYLHEQG